jgi:hypothetical protein
MITVDYPPGAVDPVHRHNAHAFVYVLQGSIVMQVRGGKEVTLVPGQTIRQLNSSKPLMISITPAVLPWMPKAAALLPPGVRRSQHHR